MMTSRTHPYFVFILCSLSWLARSSYIDVNAGIQPCGLVQEHVPVDDLPFIECISSHRFYGPEDPSIGSKSDLCPPHMVLNLNEPYPSQCEPAYCFGFAFFCQSQNCNFKCQGHKFGTLQYNAPNPLCALPSCGQIQQSSMMSDTAGQLQSSFVCLLEYVNFNAWSHQSHQPLPSAENVARRCTMEAGNGAQPISVQLINDMLGLDDDEHHSTYLKDAPFIRCKGRYASFLVRNALCLMIKGLPIKGDPPQKSSSPSMNGLQVLHTNLLKIEIEPVSNTFCELRLCEYVSNVGDDSHSHSHAKLCLVSRKQAALDQNAMQPMDDHDDADRQCMQQGALRQHHVSHVDLSKSGIDVHCWTGFDGLSPIKETFIVCVTGTESHKQKTATHAREDTHTQWLFGLSSLVIICTVCILAVLCGGIGCIVSTVFGFRFGQKMDRPYQKLY